MRIRIRPLCVLLGVVSLPMTAMAVPAQETSGQAAPVLSGEDIAKALKPQAAPSRTRGLSRRPDAPPTPQSINLDIPFKYDSSTLQPQASAQLRQLQIALTSQSLRNDRFVVAGHTDAKGNPEYNKQLSLKRAQSVRRFLVANGVDTGRLDAVGYGSEQPLTPEHPDDPANRRVEIRDLGPAPQSP